MKEWLARWVVKTVSVENVEYFDSRGGGGTVYILSRSQSKKSKIARGEKHNKMHIYDRNEYRTPMPITEGAAERASRGRRVRVAVV